ncbi:adenylate/guanylate cyclase domain-containing protein [Hoeflea sp.]|uniref:adenylate/guanylate cyclase domain-containing protein n=1 Tax=Hoeflea sp. TaxID=1940281 RepID=UPI003B0226B7
MRTPAALIESICRTTGNDKSKHNAARCYAGITAQGLYAQIITYLVGIPIISLSYFILPRNAFLAALWWIVTVCIVLFTLSYLTGRDSGFQWYFLGAPGITLSIFGSNKWRAASIVSAVLVAAILYVEFAFEQPAPFMRVDETLQRIFLTLSISGTMVFAFIPVFDALTRIREAEHALAEEHARSEALLYNLLPEQIAARLKVEPDKIIADSLPQVAILFADIVNFTPRSARMTPDEIVGFLNGIFSAFDALAEKHGLEKIKTIGDAYMVAAGMPNPCGDPVHRVAEMALDMLEVTKKMPDSVELRIGLHAGPAVAGVIGNRKLFYDVWGDTVNTASRMESHGKPGRVQVTEAAKEALGEDYNFISRGKVAVKGVGAVETFWLIGRKASKQA